MKCEAERFILTHGLNNMFLADENLRQWIRESHIALAVVVSENRQNMQVRFEDDSIMLIDKAENKCRFIVHGLGQYDEH